MHRAPYCNLRVCLCVLSVTGSFAQDHHHLLAALDSSQWYATEVTLDVVCDFSNSTSLDQFWSTMKKHGTVYGYVPTPNRRNLLAVPFQPLCWVWQQQNMLHTPALSSTQP